MRKPYHIFDGGTELSIAMEMPLLNEIKKAGYGFYQEGIGQLSANQKLPLEFEYFGDSLLLKSLKIIGKERGLTTKLGSLDDIADRDVRTVMYRATDLESSKDAELLIEVFKKYYKFVSTLCFGVPEEKQLLLQGLRKNPPVDIVAERSSYKNLSE